MTTEQTTITICNKKYFDEKLQSLQIKFAKLGCTPPKVINEVKTYHEIVIHNRLVKVPSYDITLDYETFPINGYTFVSKIDVIRQMFYTAPNMALPEEQLHYDANCEHCNMNRDRHTVYVLRNDETGEYKRIGSNCLAKYIGVNPATILAMSGNYDLFTEFLEDDELRNRPSQPDYSLKFVLSIAKFLADRVGFISLKTAKEEQKSSTASYVITILDKLPHGRIPYNSRNGQLEEFVNDILAINIMSEYADYVNGCVNWMKTQVEQTRNEYTINLANLATNDSVQNREIAFAVSALIGYNKSLNITPKPVSNSQYVGKVEDKFTAKNPLIVTCIALSTPFNKTIMVGRGFIEQSAQFYTFEDENGNQFSTCTESGKIDVGDKVKITAKVKEHKEFNGAKQTVLSHCRFTKLSQGKCINTVQQTSKYA